MTNSTPPDEIAALRAKVEELTRERDDLKHGLDGMWERVHEGIRDGVYAVTPQLRATRLRAEAAERDRDAALERGIRLGIEAAAEVADEADRQDEIDNGSAMTGGAQAAAQAIRALDPAEIVKGKGS